MMLYAHVLAATLALAAFAVLWRERDGPPRTAIVAAAGVFAGLAALVEYRRGHGDPRAARHGAPWASEALDG